MNTIFIDTTDNTKIIVRLTMGKKEATIEQPVDTRKAQIVLPLMQKLLEKHKLQPQDLDAIEVSPGPGSFTGVRVGVSIANALGFALKIPVNGIQITNGEKIEEPKY